MESDNGYLVWTDLDRPLLRFEGDSWTGRDFLAQVRKLSRLFSDRGVRAGERVLFLLENSPQFLLSMLAIQKLGATVVPFNPRSTELEWRYVLQDTDAVLVLSESALALPSDKQNLTRVDLDSITQSESPRYVAGKDDLEFDPAAPAFICYTSGTTSRPKGVVLSHANVFACLRSLKVAWRRTRNDRLLLALPLFHVHGLIVGALGSLRDGSEIVLHARFDPARVLQDLIDGACTLFMGVPAMYIQLLACARERKRPEANLHPNLRKMRLFISGSAPLPAVIHQECERIFGQKILERYGMTESLMVLSNPYEGERKAGSVGFPLPGVEVKLVDEEGGPVTRGELGEIWVRGPAVFKEYWNIREATKEVFCDGWFKTGDVAYQDSDSYFFIAGRKSLDIIKCSGFKVSAREIEERLMEIPSVREAAVVGVPDALRGEQVIAFIRCQNSPVEAGVASTAKACDILHTDLSRFLETRLARYKHPAWYVFVEALPRNAMGKVSKTAVKELAQSMF